MEKPKIFRNETKEFLLSEKRDLEAYMLTIGPGEEYDTCYSQWRQINEDLEKMSFTYKLGKVFPWIALGVSAVGSIGVPIALGTLAYRNSEEEGKLKNGDVWREATSQALHPTPPQSIKVD